MVRLINHNFDDNDKIIATFDTQEMAEAYIEKCFTKNRKQLWPFVKKSLLGRIMLNNLYIENAIEPHNP